MNAIAKLREQIKIARDAGHFVVLTADEAQAVVDQLTDSGKCMDRLVDRSANPQGGPPHDGDDEHA